MQNLLTVVFEAHNPESNHHHSYGVEVGRDLFGDYLLTARYGRAGCTGSSQRFASSDPVPLQQVMKQRLRRRLGAERRIGCPYRLVSLDCAPNLNLEDWLPREFLPTGM
jgi:WGR domain